MTDEYLIERGAARAEAERVAAIAAITGRAREAQVVFDGVVICRGCGEPIPKDRADTGAARCIGCQETYEAIEARYRRM